MHFFPDLSHFAVQTGYSPQMLQWGFDRMRAHWKRDEIEQFFAQECPDIRAEDISELLSPETSLSRRKAIFPDLASQSMLIVTASTVPPAAFQDIFTSLLAPIRVTHRPSGNQHALFQALHSWMREAYPELASRWTLLPSDHDDTRMAELIASHDVLNVSGSEATIRHFETLAALAERKPHIIAHGHRLSAAAIFRHDIPELTTSDYDALALDASVWDQTGCLSPKFVFFEGSMTEAETFARALCSSFDRVAETLPELEPESAQLAALNSACLMARFDGASIFKAHRNHDTVVLHSGNAALRPVLQPRTLNICPVENAIEAALRYIPVGQAMASRMPLPSDVESLLREHSGFNYFARFGKMQDPPLTWLHDGIGTVKPLLS